MKLRLSKILNEHRDRSGGLTKLAEDIAKATGHQIATRTLAKIIKGPTSLKMKDLIAISTFLTPAGEGLSDLPLFDADSVLRALVETGTVEVAVPTRIDDVHHRDYASVWDVRGFGKIVERINERWPETRVHLQERPVGVPEDGENFFPDPGTSYCMIGAPLIFAPSESMLAQMFNVRPFRPPTALRNVNLPFYFVWYPDRSATSSRIQSGLEFSSSDLALAIDAGSIRVDDQDLPATIEAGNAHALVVGDTLYPVYLDRQHWKDYGVIVAQRRPQGNVWVVVAGLSGPGTCAAALSLAELTIALPANSAGEASDPIYAVIEASVSIDEKKREGDARTLGDRRVLVGPKVWGAQSTS